MVGNGPMVVVLFAIWFGIGPTAFNLSQTSVLECSLTENKSGNSPGVSMAQVGEGRGGLFSMLCSP